MCGPPTPVQHGADEGERDQSWIRGTKTCPIIILAWPRASVDPAVFPGECETCRVAWVSHGESSRCSCRGLGLPGRVWPGSEEWQAAQAGQALKISLRYQSFLLLLLGFYPPQRKAMWSPEQEQLIQLYLLEPVTREKILEDTAPSLTSLAPVQVSLCESEQLS